MNWLKFVLGGFLVVGGISGTGISLLGNTVVSSNIIFINGLELSSGILLFSAIALLSGMYLMCS